MRLDETEPEGRVHYFKITSKPYLYTVERILDNIQYRKGVSLATMSDAIDIKRRIIRIRKDLGDIEDALKELSRGKKERAAAVLRDLSRPEKGIVRYTGSESVDEMRKLLNRAKRTLEMTK